MHELSKSRLVEAAERIGYLYHAWLGIIGLGATAFAFARAFGRSHPSVANTAFYIGLVCAAALLALAPLVWFVMRQRSQAEANLNPQFVIERIEGLFRVGKGRHYREKQIWARARTDTDRYRFRFRLTGTARAKVKLVSEGELRGPIFQQQTEGYEVVLPRAIKKGDLLHIHWAADIEDVNSTMRPFVSETVSIASKDASFKQTLVFENELLEKGPIAVPVRPAVYVATHDQVRSVAISPSEPVYPNQDGVYSVERHLEAGKSYVVSWVSS